MPAWLMMVLGGLGGAAGGVLGALPKPAAQTPAGETPRAAAPVWPWFAGGGALLVVLIIVLIAFGRKRG